MSISTDDNDKILFVQTGGTIDKDYPRSTGGYAFEFGEPATIRLLDRLQPSFAYTVATAFQKDSLEVTDQDREELATLIGKASESRVIVTHGTDTMIDTAKYLLLAKNEPLLKHKTIVLTGAMRPERFSNSDAPLNLGAAIAAVQLAPAGSVLVTMHGVVRPAQEATRDMETGQFK
ncbi:Glutaminase-asparaginase [Seminavis robusta]|uniref:Glutaminase-asparaginase n=1 Tax=Seminavis robusta TaxID=568900 RepID=A0A9N8HZR0_9STRA|nr:Glutaminase-asparaginase [Seminavis robusta]|eukprot:Sro2357_g324620.1 Glutaminase-asparaginase (176) ;mRNA; f:11553-12080